MVKMAINSCKSIRMINKNGLAKTSGFNTNLGDITVGSGIHGKIFPVLRAYVKTHVPMITPDFAKVGSELHGNVERIAKVIFWISDLAVYRKIKKHDTKGTEKSFLHAAKVII